MAVLYAPAIRPKRIAGVFMNMSSESAEQEEQTYPADDSEDGFSEFDSSEASSEEAAEVANLLSEPESLETLQREILLQTCFKSRTNEKCASLLSKYQQSPGTIGKVQGVAFFRKYQGGSISFMMPLDRTKLVKYADGVNHISVASSEPGQPQTFLFLHEPFRRQTRKDEYDWLEDSPVRLVGVLINTCKVMV
jgi:hypothetical protein